MVELYCRNNPDDIDDSNNLTYPVLRQPGVTALNNLISDGNIDFMFDRTQSRCSTSKGTTSNEALHRIFNGRLTRFGGIRTYATAQQNILVIQYQYNSRKLYKSGQYWCNMQLLDYNTIRQTYTSPLGESDRDVLQRLEIEWYATKWSSSHDQALERLIVELGTGEKYCHTRKLEMWLAQQEGLEGINHAVIKKKLYSRLKQLDHAILNTVEAID